MALQEFTKALQSTKEIELTVTGRRTGRKVSHPVWFVQEDPTLYLLPVKGSDSEWYKNVLQNPVVTLGANGVTWTGRATPITDPAEVHEVVEKFRKKYGAGDVKKYYSKLDVAAKVSLEAAAQ